MWLMPSERNTGTRPPREGVRVWGGIGDVANLQLGALVVGNDGSACATNLISIARVMKASIHTCGRVLMIVLNEDWTTKSGRHWRSWR